MSSLVRILLVMQQPEALAGLLGEARLSQPDWVLEFAETPSRALQRIAHKSYDVVISDSRLPNQDGTAFLTKVRERCPRALRMIWSSHADWHRGLQLLGPAHQYLTHSDPPGLLIKQIQNSLELGQRLQSDALRRVISQVQSLPSIPALYFELLQSLRAPEPDANVIAGIISRDLGMTTIILKLVNSPFFGLTHHISSAVEAVIYLGVETVERLVLSIQIFSLFKDIRLDLFTTEQLWTHSWNCGNLARRIADAEQLDTETANQAMTAGLLHDVGKLLLATSFAPDFQRALQMAKTRHLLAWQVELEVFGASHAEVGAYLLGLWGLPESIVEAVLLHHQPGDSQEAFSSPAGCVHLANALANASTPDLEMIQENLVPSFKSHPLFIRPGQQWQSLLIP
jgi:putative nucleotidyltransferase with HDIG domain